MTKNKHDRYMTYGNVTKRLRDKMNETLVTMNTINKTN
nr:MAG: hypothetical protein [Apis mellifera filamentous virus]WOK43653.1 MAG: hypothetical protein [Apis mellifera filamentous virus]